MPEPKKTLVFYEGDDDKAFLEQLHDAELLPPGWDLAKRDKNQHPGKEGLVAQLLPVVSPVDGIAGRAVVLVDLDDLTATIVGRLVKKGIETLGKDGFTALAEPFLDDLAAANELLNG